MARARNIKPGFFRNAELVELPFEARLLFIGLWTIADREGRLEDRHKQIKMEVFPADNVDCNKLIESLELAGMIERYTVEGMAYIHILSFTKHQNPHKDEKSSEIPDKHGCLSDSRKTKHHASTMQAPCKEGATSEAILLIPDSLIPDSLLKTPSVMNEKIPRSSQEEKIIFYEGQFTNTERRASLWEAAYPAVNIKTEIAKAAAWLLANPKNAKQNYERFLTNWLGRAQERAPAAGNTKEREFVC